MSSSNQPDIQSFFSVGGIHGLPFQPWDGVLGNRPFNPNSNQWGGYCTHGSTLFPTWHRPYVMLYEVCPTSFLVVLVIDEAIILLANFATACAGNRCDIHSQHTGLEESRRWSSSTLLGLGIERHPSSSGYRATAGYHHQQHWKTSQSWQSTLPLQISSHWQFLPGSFQQLADYTQTANEWRFRCYRRSWRAPEVRLFTYDSCVEYTDDIFLTSTLASEQSQITTSTYNLLTRVHTWPAFSNHSVDDGGSSSSSLEAIHDGIHVDVGGQGHMADPAVAGEYNSRSVNLFPFLIFSISIRSYLLLASLQRW